MAVYLCKIGTPVDNVHIALNEYYDINFSIADVIDRYRRTEVASESVPHAIVCALEAVSFDDAIRKPISLGGDTYTQAAIAGGIAEARFSIPAYIRKKILKFL